MVDRDTGQDIKTEAQLRKAERTRHTMKVVIITILAIVLVALGGVIYYVGFYSAKNAPTSTAEGGKDISGNVGDNTVEVGPASRPFPTLPHASVRPRTRSWPP